MVPRGATIASAAVLVFMCGRQRIVEPDGRVGVHEHRHLSFGASDDEPPDALSSMVAELIGLHTAMLGEQGSAFYRFMLEAAPFEDMHWMSTEELQRFGLMTQ